MGLTQQSTGTQPTTVRVDWPVLPSAPQMTLPADNAALSRYAGQMAAWYESFKTATLDKLNALASEIDTLKSKVK